MSLNLLVLADPNASWLKLLERLDSNVQVTITNDEAEVRAAAPNADAILNGTFTARMLSIAVPLAAKAQWVHSLWTGVDSVWSPELQASPIPLTNGRGVFRVSLAEWTIGAMLHFSYQMRRMIRQQEGGVWEIFTTEELYGRTLGVIGYGEIGRAAAERAKAFGMKVLALRRRPELSSGDPLVEQTFDHAHINDLMSASDYVMVAAPLTPETRGLVGAAQIAAMKPNAVIINVGRGAIIDEPALIAALEGEKIRGAALDVFTVEPLPTGHAFYKLKNVLMSPHTADHVQDFVHLAVECFLDNMRLFQAKQPLQNIVDKRAGY
ncbi:MAG: D-2-hydroxyacid dehydrogenase [Bryobacteraceae bacterium]